MVNSAIFKEGIAKENASHTDSEKHFPHQSRFWTDPGMIWSRDTEKNYLELSSKKEWISEVGMHQKEIMYSKFTKNIIKLYTDGFETSIGTGVGVYRPRMKYSEAIGTYPIIFQAKAYAIRRCTWFTLNRNYRYQYISILSDSQAAIKANQKEKAQRLLLLLCGLGPHTVHTGRAKAWNFWGTP